MSVRSVLFNNTVLRDGHQSMAATRMTTAQMLPAAPILDGMGFNGLETWGGATIDSCLRFLNENPFDRLRALKRVAPKTPQLMLLRGQNIVQYASFPDDVVRGVRALHVPERHGYHPHFRRAERRAQPAHGHQGRERLRQARPRRALLHHQPGPHGRELRQHGRRAGEDGLRFARHQGHVGHPAAANRLPLGQGIEAKVGIPITAAHARHRRLGRGQLIWRP